MGCCIVVVLVLAGLVDWVGPLFLAVGSMLLFLTNTALVALLRHRCRGGRPHRARTWVKASARRCSCTAAVASCMHALLTSLLCCLVLYRTKPYCHHYLPTCWP
jgi:amino acid transporter